MVERGGDPADPVLVPSIASLLAQYRDRTGASYDDMERSLGGAISRGRLQQLVTTTPKNFPDPDNVQHLADLLHVSVTTILEAFAVSLGLTVEQRRPLLAISLPPGTDNLTDRDRMSIIGIVRQLVEARQAATAPEPDLSAVQGVRLAEDPVEHTRADTRNGR
jgi:hypothetical protein